jgi:DNA polymerase IV
MSGPTRKIIHIDMDCFFAAVEIRDFPHLRGLPIAVGAPQAPRGVLCTASYEARQFGVRAAMPNRMALAKCPQLLIQPLRMDVYKQESAAIQAIFRQYTQSVQPLSLDEAFLDVTDCPLHGGSATRIAQEILLRIKVERGLSASAGVATNKFLAKIASEQHKPGGLFVLPPAQIAEFLHTLPVHKIWGVGPKGAAKLHAQGFQTCGDLQKASRLELSQLFGRSGDRLWHLCRGIDLSPVQIDHNRKSLSKERTFDTDRSRSLAHQIADELLRETTAAWQRWSTHKIGYSIVGLEVKIRFHDFHTTTAHAKGPPRPEVLRRLVETALQRHGGDLRLVGVGFQLQAPPTCEQLCLDLQVA